MAILISREEIIGHLARVESGVISVSALCREVGISKTTFYKWRKQYYEFNLPDNESLAQEKVTQLDSGKIKKTQKPSPVSGLPARSFQIDEVVFENLLARNSTVEFSVRSVLITLVGLYALLLVVAYWFGYSVQNFLPSIQYERRAFFYGPENRFSKIRRIKELRVDEGSVLYSVEDIWGKNPATQSSKHIGVHKPEDCRFLHAKTWVCRGDFGDTSMTDGVLKQNYQEFQKQLVFFGLRLNLP